MIIHHIIIGLLLYSPSVLGQSSTRTEENSTNPKSSTPNQIDGVPDPLNDAFSDTAIDTLISKVVELSERYRSDVNGTIADVQQMVQSDSTLPRLTHGEIIDLLENLTKTTPEAWKEKIEKSRKDYQRAIMLVMPYTPKNTDSLSIEELYTKPPITHIVGNEPQKPVTRKPQNTNKHIEILALEPSTSRPPMHKRPYKPVKQFKPETNQETKTQYHVEQKPKKEVAIKQVPVKPEITTRKPEISSRKPEIATRKTIIPKPTRFSNHRYPDERGFVPSNQGMKIINAPSLAVKPEMINNEFYQAEKLVKPEIKPDWQPERENKPHTNRIVRPSQSSVYKSSTMRPRIRTTISTTTRSPLANLDIPDEMKDAVKDVHFGEMVPMEPPKYSSQYDASSMNFPKQESSTENVRDLLDSIGVLPQQTTTVMPDISEIADTLSPDMRELLMSFGLLENPNTPARNLGQPIISQPNLEEPDISPYSYMQFKPLPDSAPSREDMQEFLAGFGLTGNSQRSAKKLKTPEEPPKQPTQLSDVPEINMEMIPESMHDVLEDIGLAERKEKKLIDQEAKETHVFNPEQTYVPETEIKRLNQLLETIKRLEKMNRTATAEDLKDLDLQNIRELTKILKQDASIPLDQQNFGPDPFDFSLSPDKNEVKRQESTTTTTESSSTEAIKEEEPNNPPLAALEESFGGNTGAAAETVDESLPPPRRTGFYYLVDWNSFLEVGEEGKNKVNIRFSPQAGDPSRFLRVNVP